MPDGTRQVTVTAPASCAPGQPASTSRGSGSSAGTLATAQGGVLVNLDTDAPRAGLVMVRWPTPTAGQNVRVAQAGCTYGVTQSAFDVAAGGGDASFFVLQQSVPILCGGPFQDACVWSAVADVPWITITTPMPRHGDNPVAFTVAPNLTGAPRSGTITVRDKVVRVNQAGSRRAAEG